MKTKYEIVQKLSFMKRIYSKISGSGFEKAIEGQDVPTIDACGVFFFKEYAYSTNNHIVCRIKVDDNMPVQSPIFWSYRKNDENITRIIVDKFLLNVKNYCVPNTILSMIFNEHFIDNLNYFFERSSDNTFYFRKDDMLNMINNYYEANDNKKMKILVSIYGEHNFLYMDFNPCKPSVRNISHKESIHLFSRPDSEGFIKSDGSKCSINLFYLYEILKNGFDDNDVVGIKYKNDKNVPVVIFSSKKNKGKPHICWAIAQSTC